MTMQLVYEVLFLYMTGMIVLDISLFVRVEVWRRLISNLTHASPHFVCACL